MSGLNRKRLHDGHMPHDLHEFRRSEKRQQIVQNGMPSPANLAYTLSPDMRYGTPSTSQYMSHMIRTHTPVRAASRPYSNDPPQGIGNAWDIVGGHAQAPQQRPIIYQGNAGYDEIPYPQGLQYNSRSSSRPPIGQNPIPVIQNFPVHPGTPQPGAHARHFQGGYVLANPQHYQHTAEPVLVLQNQSRYPSVSYPVHRADSVHGIQGGVNSQSPVLVQQHLQAPQPRRHRDVTSGTTIQGGVRAQSRVEAPPTIPQSRPIETRNAGDGKGVREAVKSPNRAHTEDRNGTKESVKDVPKEVSVPEERFEDRLERMVSVEGILGFLDPLSSSAVTDKDEELAYLRSLETGYDDTQTPDLPPVVEEVDREIAFLSDPVNQEKYLASKGFHGSDAAAQYACHNFAEFVFGQSDEALDKNDIVDIAEEHAASRRPDENVQSAELERLDMTKRPRAARETDEEEEHPADKAYREYNEKRLIEQKKERERHERERHERERREREYQEQTNAKEREKETEGEAEAKRRSQEFEQWKRERAAQREQAEAIEEQKKRTTEAKGSKKRTFDEDNGQDKPALATKKRKFAPIPKQSPPQPELGVESSTSVTPNASSLAKTKTKAQKTVLTFQQREQELLDEKHRWEDAQDRKEEPYKKCSDRIRAINKKLEKLLEQAKKEEEKQVSRVQAVHAAARIATGGKRPSWAQG